MNKFFVGIAECGCVVAAMIDDGQTTSKDLAWFKKTQFRLKREVKHVEAEQPWMSNPECKAHERLCSIFGAPSKLNRYQDAENKRK